MNDFDLSGIDLEGSGDIEISDDATALNAALGVEGLNLDADDGLGTFEVDTGADISIDFDEDVDSLSASTLLRSQVDISKTFVEYYNSVRDAWVKVRATSQTNDVKLSNPPITAFNYLYDKAQIPIVYRYFCATLNDLSTLEEHRDKTTEEAYQYLLDAMYNDIRFTPNIYEEKFHRTFCQYYEKNKKLSSVKTKAQRGTIGSVIDQNRLQKSLNVYAFNSQPFDAASKFLSDINLIDGGRVYRARDLDSFGDFADYLKQQYKTSSLSFSDVYNGIITFLSSDEVLKMLQLPEESRADFSIGELLRRYIVCELKSGDLYPTGFKGLNAGSYSNEFIAKVIQNLESLRKSSISAEIIYFLADLMFSSKARDARDDYFVPFITGISQFLSAYIEDRALVNPVFYAYIGHHKDETDGREQYELGYAEGDQSLTVVSPDILCEVVGDNVSVLCVPLVYVDGQTNSVICPPVEVFKGVQKVASSGRLPIAGNVAYRYTPSYSWISTLSISTSEDVKEEITTNEIIGQTNNPLLDVLLHYDNDFDMSGIPPKVVAVDVKDVGYILGVKLPNSDTVPILSMRMYDGSAVIDNGTFAIDDTDGSLIVRYTNPLTGAEDVAFYDSDSFEEQQSSVVQGSDNTLPSVDQIVSCNINFEGFEDEAYLGCVAKRICDLNALDYDAELEHARQVIVRDLERVVDVTFIDRILGRKILQEYLQLISQNKGTLDSFNFSTLKEVVGFMFGEPNCLTGVNELTPDLVKELQALDKQANDATVGALVASLDVFDPHVIAMQVISRSELSDGGDRQLYNAIHCFPEVYARLYTLENLMVLLSALNEVSDDIAPVLRKMSPMYTAYNTVCTKDTVDKVESNLKSGMKIPGVAPCLNCTRRVLTEKVQEGVVILKYFILERNTYGVLTGFEECFEHGSDKYRELYENFKEELGIQDIPKITDLSVEKFKEKVSDEAATTAFNKLHNDLLKVIDDGLIAEVSAEVDLQVIKAYDMLVAYGRHMFNLQEKDREDFTDTTEFSKDFYTYVGSFMVTYCPVLGEAAGEVDGGFDRYSAYIRHRDDFKADISLPEFEQFALRDLKLVADVQDEEILGEGNDAV